MWLQEYCTCAELLHNNFTDNLRRYPDPRIMGWRMSMQILPGLVVRRPGFQVITAIPICHAPSSTARTNVYKLEVFKNMQHARSGTSLANFSGSTTGYSLDIAS